MCAGDCLMSELFFANLSQTRKFGKMGYDTRSNLVDFEEYLKRAKKQIESNIPLARWELEGEYHSLSPILGSQEEIRNILSQEGSYELRFVNEDKELVKLDILHIYVPELVIILDSLCDFKNIQLTYYNQDNQGPTVYDLLVKHIPTDSIGDSFKLPHYRIVLEALDDSDEAHQNLRLFFDDDNRQVNIISESDSTRNRLIKAMWKSRISRIKHQDFKNKCLHVNRIPNNATILAIKANSYVIERQLSSIRRLKNSPLEPHRPLIRLFEDLESTEWPEFNPKDVNLKEFKFLKDGFSGVDSQRDFVQIALTTPDFAILEGPPGSGKTAVISEIISQAIGRGERVLLSASTHVAVDNVIERLKDEKNLSRDEILLVRIGQENTVSSEAAKYTLENFVNTEIRELKKVLDTRKELTDWQITLKNTLDRSRDEAETLIRRLILNSAQVICGTTIGILQHPEIKRIKDDGRPVDPIFDMLILDEASKTTFSEFIVPALYTKKWIIVGDCRQLSPYIDDREIEINVEASFDRTVDDKIGSKSLWRERCFQIHDGIRNAQRASVIIQINDDEDRNRVILQAINTSKLVHGDKSGELVYDLSKYNRESEIDRLSLSSSGVVVGTKLEISNHERDLPINCIHLNEEILDVLNARSEAAKSNSNFSILKDESWKGAITWRMKKEYERKLFDSDLVSDKNELVRNLAPLMPSKHISKKEVDASIDLLNVFRIGFPSVLESLQFGFGRGRKLKTKTKNALTHGLPKKALNSRHIALEYQHRMHPSISKSPRESIYGGKLLLDSENIEKMRSQFPEDRRVIWIDVPDGDEKGRSKSNSREVDAVIARVKHLHELLSNYKHPDGENWSVAVLTFYRGQEREIRKRLKQLTKNNRSPYKFGPLSIDLCTVDRFQGHEADIVILSYVRTKSVGFLDSPNRLNVATTRARYQMIHVGKKRFFNNKYIKKKARYIYEIIQNLPKEAFVTDIREKHRRRS
mgnify:FL=1|jgi:hypothetical protein